MISWIQRYFQHHFRIIFGLVLLATIVGFVIAFTPGSTFGNGNQQRSAQSREFFGYNLSSQEDEGRLFGDANLSATLLTGYSSLDSNDLQNYAMQRAAALHLADEMHLPAATGQEITDLIQTLAAFRGEDQQFDAKRYDSFRDSLKLPNSRINEAMVRRVLGDDVRAEKVKKVIAGPGYVLSADVKAQLDRADSLWTLGVATVDYASYAPSIPVSELALAKYFEDNSFRYTIPAKVAADAAYFPAAAFTAGQPVSDGEVRAYYDANPARWPNPAAKPGVTTDRAADYAAVRPQVEAALKMERGKLLAAKAASDLSFALYEGKVVLGNPAFNALLAAQHATLRHLAPFTREDGPAEFAGSPEIANEAFKLSASRTYSDAVATPEGAAVLFWKESIAPRQPLLAEVRAKVAADYTENEKRKRFVETGRLIRSQIETRLKAGDTFEKAVAAAASATSTKIEAKTLAPFSRRTPSKDADSTVTGALDRLNKGQVSDMSIIKDQGVLVYAQDKKLPDLSETGPAYVAMRAQLAAVNARIGASSYLSELVATELKKSDPAAK
ncbi:MAG: peptidyl-prolyl cis-trans isomerase [Opitutaceae bacterium]